MSPDTAAFLQAAIGTVFVLAATAKILHKESLPPFLHAMGFSRGTSSLISRVAPLLEGFVGVSLLSGVAFPAAAAAAVLSLVFCVVLILAQRRGVDEGCRCFGFLDSGQLSVWPVARAVVLAVGALLLSSSHLEGDPVVWSELWRGPTVVVTILGTFAGVGYVAVFGLLEQVHHFERRRPHRMPAPKGEVPQGTVVRNVPT